MIKGKIACFLLSLFLLFFFHPSYVCLHEENVGKSLFTGCLCVCVRMYITPTFLLRFFLFFLTVS